MYVEKFQGSVIREQGVSFAVVIVKPNVVDNKPEADRTIANFQLRVFPGIPVVLMEQNHEGVPRYYGRKDLVNFLARVPLQSIPWKEYTFG